MIQKVIYFAMYNTTNQNATYNGTQSNLACIELLGDLVKCDIVVAIKRISASASVVGCILVILLIVLFKKYNDASQRMITNLAVASMLESISIVLVDITNESTTICKAQGGLLTFFVWECFLWISCIMFNLYFKVVFKIDIKRFEIPTFIVFWLLPSIPFTLGFVYDLYGPAGAWCWMINDWKWRLATVYLWKMLSVIVFIIIMVHMLITLHRMKREMHTSAVSFTSLKEDMRTLTDILSFISL